MAKRDRCARKVFRFIRRRRARGIAETTRKARRPLQRIKLVFLGSAGAPPKSHSVSHKVRDVAGEAPAVRRNLPTALLAANISSGFEDREKTRPCRASAE